MNIENILKTGTLVEIEYAHEDGHVTKLNTLVDYPLRDGYLTIYAPMIKGAVFPMREYDTLWLIFMTDNADKSDKDVYKFKCRIEQRGYTNGIAVYKLFKLTNPEKVQRRGAYRLPIVKDFTLIHGEEHKLLTITTVNISGTGVKAICTEKLEANEPVILNLDTDLEVLQIPSKVIICNYHPDSINKFDLRLQFMIDKESLSQKLNAYLFKKQSEVIQKNLDSTGYSELYYRLYEKDKYDPEKESANKQSNIFVWIAFALTMLSLFALYIAVPAEPIIIFKTLLKLNYAYKAWNFTYLFIAMATSLVALPVSIVGIFMKRRFRLENQLPVHIPLLMLAIINFFTLVYSYYHYYLV